MDELKFVDTSPAADLLVAHRKADCCRHCGLAITRAWLSAGKTDIRIEIEVANSSRGICDRL